MDASAYSNVILPSGIVPPMLPGLIPPIPPTIMSPYQQMPTPQLPSNTPQIIQNRINRGTPEYSPLQSSPVGGSLIYSGQTTLTSPSVNLSEHPCGGKGGSGCGCGGSCTAKVTYDTYSDSKNTTPDYKPDESLLKDLAILKSIMDPNLYQSKVLHNLPGNSTYMTAEFMNGAKFLSTAKVLDDRRIVLETVNVLENNKILELSFLPLSDGQGWQMQVPNNIEAPIIPADMPLDGFTIFGSAVAIGKTLIESKLAQKNKVYSTPQSIQGINSAPCVAHDLLCSDFTGKQGSTWPFTGDKKHIQFVAPCIGSFFTDVSSCCKDHDIELWCAHGLTEIDLANEAVIICVLNHVIASAYQQLYEKIKHDTVLQIIYESLYCFGLMNIWAIWLYKTFFFSMSAAYFAVFHGQNAMGDLNPDLFNFHGEHDESCLCGGNKPTVQCGIGNECRDLCKEFGKKADCYDCKWKCVYSRGKVVDKIWDTGQQVWNGESWVQEKPCCIANTKECIGDFDGRKTDCPNCNTDCYWKCEDINVGTKRAGQAWHWMLHNPTNNGALCCPECLEKPKTPCWWPGWYTVNCKV